MFGRYAQEGAYISYDLEVARAVTAATSSVGTQGERRKLYHNALKIIYDKHYDFSPGFISQPYGISQHVSSWEPWPLAPYASTLWTVQIK